MVYKSLNALQTLLFPHRCRLCRGNTDVALDLCRHCLADTPRIITACAQCSRPLPENGGLCGQCQQHRPAFDATTALFHYQPPIDHLIKRFKFAGELALAPLLAELLTVRLRTRAAPLPGLLIPVPLHRSRLRERGFNQATELATRAGRELGIRCDPRLCQRQRQTQPQSLLSPHARRLNVRNAFTLNKAPDCRHVAIVDDVMTTGHTGNELARLLKQAGVKRVELWVIARAGY